MIRLSIESVCKTDREITASWWNQLKMMEEKSFGDTFLTEDEIVDHLLGTFKAEIIPAAFRQLCFKHSCT